MRMRVKDHALESMACRACSFHSQSSGSRFCADVAALVAASVARGPVDAHVLEGDASYLAGSGSGGRIDAGDLVWSSAFRLPETLSRLKPELQTCHRWLT